MLKNVCGASVRGISWLRLTPKLAGGTCKRRWLSSSGFSPLSPMSLDEVMKKDMIIGESPDRLKVIWTEYHNTKTTSVGHTISDEENQKMIERLKESPIFIHPVFKDETQTPILSYFRRCRRSTSCSLILKNTSRTLMRHQWATKGIR